MTAFYGARDMDIAEPRPVWQTAKIVLCLVLAVVLAVEFVFLVFVLMVIVGAV